MSKNESLAVPENPPADYEAAGARKGLDGEWRLVAPIPSHAPRRPRMPGFGEPALVYEYVNPAGSLLFYVLRFEKDGRKEFRPLTLWRNAQGVLKWHQKAYPARRPLYALNRLHSRPGDLVLLVEGEKAASRAQVLLPDYAVTTLAGGAYAVSQTDWGPLKDRHIVIWRDNDEAGLRFQEAAWEALKSAGAALIRTVELPEGLPDKWDLGDYLEGEPLTLDQIKGHIERAKTVLDDAASWQNSLVEASKTDAGAPFEPEALERLLVLKETSPADWQRVRGRLKSYTPVSVGDLDRELAKRAVANGQGGSGEGLPVESPWPEPVDGAELLNELVSALKKYVLLPDHAAEAIALWVLFAYVHDAALISPLLVISSPEKQCGKTTLVSVLSELLPRPKLSSHLTPAVLFRVVDRDQPTLLIDEGDAFLKENEDFRGLLNAGHTKRFATVDRCEGDNHEPRAYSVWCPKVIALIGNLHGTLEDRSIKVRLQRKPPGEKLERFRIGQDKGLGVLRQKALRWAEDHIDGLDPARPEPPEKLSDRAADNWGMLLAIAEAAGGAWPEAGRQAAIALSAAGKSETESLGAQLLRDIKLVFDAGVEGAIQATRLRDELVNLDESPWSEVSYGKPLTTTRLARLLRPYGIASERTRVARQYRNADFYDAWTRYLSLDPPSQPVTPDTALNSLENSDFQHVTRGPLVTGLDPEKPNDFKGVTGVTGCQGGLRERKGKEAKVSPLEHGPQRRAQWGEI